MSANTFLYDLFFQGVRVFLRRSFFICVSLVLLNLPVVANEVGPFLKEGFQGLTMAQRTPDGTVRPMVALFKLPDYVWGSICVRMIPPAAEQKKPISLCSIPFLIPPGKPPVLLQGLLFGGACRLTVRAVQAEGSVVIFRDLQIAEIATEEGASDSESGPLFDDIELSPGERAVCDLEGTGLHDIVISLFTGCPRVVPDGQPFSEEQETIFAEGTNEDSGALRKPYEVGSSDCMGARDETITTRVVVVEFPIL